MNLRIIPKIDIKNRNLVKGIHLEGLRSLGNPRSFVEIYYSDGADEIIYHDVVASLYERNNAAELIKDASKNIFLPMTVGGGINKLKEVEKILRSEICPGKKEVQRSLSGQKQHEYDSAVQRTYFTLYVKGRTSNRYEEQPVFCV